MITAKSEGGDHKWLNVNVLAVVAQELVPFVAGLGFVPMAISASSVVGAMVEDGARVCVLSVREPDLWIGRIKSNPSVRDH